PSTRPASRSRRHSTSRGSARPSARSIEVCAASTSGAAVTVARAVTRLSRHLRRSPSSPGRATSCRPSSSGWATRARTATVSYEAGPNQPPYRPLNYDRAFKGPVTLRHALEDSRNIPAVKAMAAVGPGQVVATAKRLGLTGRYQPYLSLALGAAESTLLEMT